MQCLFAKNCGTPVYKFTRDIEAFGLIVTRITSKRDLMSAQNTAQSVLRIKDEAIRVELHCHEGIQSNYLKKPMAVLDRE